jgi:hypothetical protein
MAKKNEDGTDSIDTPLTITEFCMRLSQTDRRVELIGAFHATETKAGNIKATETEFRARFDDFLTQPA